jgi:glyoxylase-like metal-dependent hydrolase (beta-lactamase superfamily II)
MLEFQPVTAHILRLEVAWRIGGVLRVPVSVWLVRGDGGWTLVDTGPAEAADQVVSALVRGTGGQGVQRILLTHGHYDHAGGLAALRLAWNPPVMCHALEVPFVTGEARYRDIPPRHLAYWVGRNFLPRIDWQHPVARDLEAGQSADGMAVIHLPGHSPGHVGFLHPADRAMICGDALMTLWGRLQPPFAMATPDPAATRASMIRLGDLDFAHLLVSHGHPIVERGREAVLDFLEARRYRPPPR